MSNYDISRSNQQLEEGEVTSVCVGIKKNSKKNKGKNKKNKKVSRTTKITRRTRETEETEHTLEESTSNNNIERNILREEPVNEQQIQDSINENSESNYTNNTENSLNNTNNTENSESNNTNNIELDSIEVDTRQNNNTTQLTNNQSSFIWNYLEKLTPSDKYKRRVRCLVSVTGHDGEQPCGHIMGSDGSTGNFIHHLVKHNITRDTEVTQNNENTAIKSKSSSMANNPVRKSRLDKKFVGIVVKDNQPLSIRDDEGFREFVEELDPFYELPSDKKVKALLVDGYNYCKQEISHLFEQGVASCSLTLDLWTSRSRAGYLGVTCSFVNTQFELHEAILSIKYLKYPHTSDIIVECLNQIIHEWKLDGKVFTITTDNGSNMVKAGRLLKDKNNITRFPCAAHTLQLVVGKGLLPAERLVARAKRLINFFTTPKQTEKLIEIQKNMNSGQHRVRF
jgi:hypothetical protein